MKGAENGWAAPKQVDKLERPVSTQALTAQKNRPPVLFCVNMEES